MKKQTKLGLVLAAAAVISVSVASLVSARGWVQQGADWYYVDNDGEYVTDTIQSSGNAKFYLGEDGMMMKDYFLEEYSGAGNGTYYFGANGAMVTNTWVAIESSRVENQQDYIPDNYWYYFQASGKAMKGNSSNPKKTTIDGKKYLFNEYGQMLTGWITNDGKTVNPDDEVNPFKEATYYAGGDNDGVLRTGWVTYYDGYGEDVEWLTDKTNLYFYFNTSNNKKIAWDQVATTKKINGKTYGFNSEGIMISGWDQVNGDADISSLNGKKVYFSGEDDGHQVKKGWVYDVPAESIDTDAYGDGEEKYMYFNNSGDAVYDQIKKINGKYYVFNRAGIMKTGLVVWCPNGTIVTTDSSGLSKFIKTLDLDWATGEELSKKGILRYDKEESDYMKVDADGRVIVDYGGADIIDDPVIGDEVVLQYFGSDGARKTGTNNIEFSDDVFTFVSNNSGNKKTGSQSKKYYSMGILLKASQDIKYGLYNVDLSTDSSVGTFQAPVFTAQEVSYYDKLLAGDEGQAGRGYLILNTSGAKQKGNDTAKKDADGNYWMIDKRTANLVGIYTQNIKLQNKEFVTKNIAANKLVAMLSAGKLRGSSLTSVHAGLRASASDLEAEGLLDLDELYYSATLAGSGWGSSPADMGNELEYTLKYDSSNSAYYFETSFKSRTYFFQNDIRGKSNQWIPFGTFDDANGSCTVREMEGLAKPKFKGYQVTPTNDYFLNCYWVD